MLDEINLRVGQILDARYLDLLEILNEFALDVSAQLPTHHSKQALREIDLEIKTILSTVDAFTADVSQPPGLVHYLEVVNLLVHLERYLSLKGYWVEKRDWCLRLIKQGRLVRPAHGILSVVYNMLGSAFSELNDNDNALFFYDLALTESSVEENDPQLGRIYANLGVTHWQVGHLGKSLEYLELALETELKRRDQHSIAMLLADMAQVFFEAGYRIEALENSMNALTLAKEIGDVALEAQFTAIVAGHAMGVDLYDEAQALYEKAAQLCLATQDEIGVALTRLNYAVLCTHLKQNEQAKQLLDESLPTFERYFMKEESEKAQALLKMLKTS